MRIRRLLQGWAVTALVLVVITQLAVPAAPASAWSGATSSGTFTKLTNAGIPYWLYVPASYVPGTPMPLVLELQGCNQSATDAALGTRWSAVAEAEGFIVAYPEVQVNPLNPGSLTRCWDFFNPLEWKRTGGQAGAIASVAQKVMTTHTIAADHVFVTGASAGGAMSAIVAAFWPDLFASAANLLGCSYPCGDVTGLGAYTAMGANARQVPMFIAVGGADPAISPAVGEVSVLQWLATDDYVDDGLLNGSVSLIPAAVTQHAAVPGPADPCLPPGPTTLPCPGGILGWATYPYTVRSYDDAAGENILDYWVIYGLTHGYPGGDPTASFTDPQGPAVTEAIYDFFMAHPK